MLLCGCDLSFLKTVHVLEVNLVMLFFLNMFGFFFFFFWSLYLYFVACPFLVGFWLSQNPMVGESFLW